MASEDIARVFCLLPHGYLSSNNTHTHARTISWLKQIINCGTDKRTGFVFAARILDMRNRGNRDLENKYVNQKISLRVLNEGSLGKVKMDPATGGNDAHEALIEDILL